MEKLTILFLYAAVQISILITCAAVDTIAVNQTIKDGDTIISTGGNFEMGFFSPGSSKNRYVGIWYKKISTCTVVWVANTEAPLTNKSGELKVNQGGLELLNGNNTVIWSTNLVSVTTRGLVAQLSDTGNLVLQDQGNIIWESFDYPRDTLLSGMKIRKDLVTGKDIHLTSWKTDDDPSAGPYVLRVVPSGYPQLFEKRSMNPWSRFGPWNGVTFNGMPNLGENSIFTHEFVFNEKEIYYKYELVNDSLVSRMHLSPDGNIRHWNWINRTQSWSVFSTATLDNCATYGICGPYGVCNINNAPACSCMEGFEPQHPEQWNVADWSSGCKRIKPLTCGNGDEDGFRNISGVKFPDTNNSWYNQSMTLGECELACKKNCSCTAYASLDIRNDGSGCLLWFDDLMDVRVYEETEILHIRMPISELTSPTAQKQISSKKKQPIIIVVSAVTGSVLLCLILAMYVAWRKKKVSRKPSPGPVPASDEHYTIDDRNEDTELSSFSFSMISMFTNNFDHDNKLDNSGSTLLDWPRRFRIIHGIARGLLYLHHDSRLRIIHRDMKASNVLLDKDMNPKISDFGLARRFSGYETEANTNRVVGTYGYIPPEYAVHGLFSVKSDVYSFGVLVLEIASGKKNRGYSQEEHNGTLIGHAWRLHREDKSLELVSSSLRPSCVESQVLRSIHIGLLCVQHHPDDRPTMASVVSMLGNENSLPEPKQPAFFAEEGMPELKSFSSAPTLDSVDEITITLLNAR
uniref:Receptor-like serine/threonine-protein kinase n=1 Tax=Tanacetum cinerariifolium TaxID=118510 RepID=A0A6L2L6E0_TANCI|nr:apple-like protein [Tanacetum cinerariifolium]